MNEIIKAERTLSKVFDATARFGGYLGGLLIAAISCVVFIGIITRYFFGYYFSWMVDFSILSNVALSYLPLAFVQAEKKHIKVDILTAGLSQWQGAVWGIITDFIGICIVGILAFVFFNLSMDALKSHQVHWGVWNPPLFPLRMIVFLSTCLLELQLFKDLYTDTYNAYMKSATKLKGEGRRVFFFLTAFIISLLIGFAVLSIDKTVSMFWFLITVIVFGLPIYLGLALIGIGFLYGAFGPLFVFDAGTVALFSMERFSFIALPLFILSGIVLERGGVIEPLFEFARKWVGRVPGSMALASIVSCAIFSAISCSSLAAASIMGLLIFPVLVSKGYNRSFSSGVLAFGGTLGIMIPPSAIFIIYSAVTEESLGQLFFSGIGPGIIIAGLASIYCIIYCKATGTHEEREVVKWKERLTSLKEALPGLGFPIVVLGGIYLGVFTAIEAAAVSVLYSLFVVLALKRMAVKDILQIILTSARMLSAIAVLVICAGILGVPITLLQLPEKLISFISEAGFSAGQIIFSLFIIYLVGGCIMEAVTMLLISLPFAYPLAIEIGVNGIWFGAFVVLMTELALITPPLGLNLFIVQGVTGVSFSEVTKGALPFVIILCMGLLLMWFFPQIVLFLPSFVAK